jgi:hypothetical protein
MSRRHPDIHPDLYADVNAFVYAVAHGDLDRDADIFEYGNTIKHVLSNTIAYGLKHSVSVADAFLYEYAVDDVLAHADCDRLVYEDRYADKYADIHRDGEPDIYGDGHHVVEHADIHADLDEVVHRLAHVDPIGDLYHDKFQH